MNSTQEEAVSTLLEWAKEDENSRGLLIIADDEDCIRSGYNGTEINLVTALVVAMRQDYTIRQVFTKAITLLKEYEARKTNEQGNDEE